MSFFKIKLLIISAILLAASSAFADFYEVTLDTSSLTGSSAYLYLQYTPVNGVASSATVFNFSTDGLLGAQDTVNVVNGSAVTGSLPGTVVLGNANGTNDYNHALTLGSIVDFIVYTANAANSTGTGGSTFSVGLFGDAAGLTPLLNVNGGLTAGTALMINQFDNGATSTLSLDSTATANATTPIPAAAWLLGSGIMGLAGLRRKQA